MATLDARPSDVTRPTRFLVRMGIFLALVTLVVALLHREIARIFATNPVLNGLIVATALLGIVYIVRQVFLLGRSTNWIEAYMEGRSGVDVIVPPTMLAPIAAMLRQARGRGAFSAMSTRSILDSLGARLEESREIARYLIGLLIFLGLLGTFWGLLETVTAVGDTISGLSGAVADPAALFEDLKLGLETPLSGMGTAFSSSLFGLAGSLVLGFLELQAGQAHNRFMNDLEEWLSGVTRLSSGGVGGEGDPSVPAYIQALLEQTADSLDALQRTVARGEEDRGSVNQNLGKLTERLGTLTDQMRTEQGVLLRLAETQSQLKPLLMRLAEVDFATSGIDDATRGHIRNLDTHVERLVGEMTTGRDHTVQEIRSEIRLLARTIAAIAEEEQG